jgi:iron complex outermembrane recepter protein
MRRLNRHVLILIYLIPLAMSGQFKLVGTIDDGHEPQSFASVIVRDSAKNIITYDVSDEKGAFYLEVSEGNFVLEVSFLGYENWEMPINIKEDLLGIEVSLSLSSELLEEVVIKERKRLIELKSDRMYYNVENSIASKGGDALDAISSAPGVVFSDDVIEIIGRGSPGIMVQGRIVKLSGPDLVSYLNSIPSDDIKRIEIITNPPAKYAAEGSGGLINIVYKPGVRDKWKNSIRTGYEKRDNFGLFSFGNSLMYNKGKVRLNLGLNGVLGTVELDDYKSISYPSNTVTATEKFNQRRDNLSGRISLDYVLSKKTTIGFQYERGHRNQGGDTNNSTTIQQIANPLDCMFVSSGNFDWKNRYNSYNFHVITSPSDQGFNISFDLDYFNFDGDIERVLETDVIKGNSSIGENQGRNISEQLTDNYSAKLDFTHPTENIKFNYGIHFNRSGSNNRTQYIDAIGSEPVPFTDYEYMENVNALYLSGSKKIGSKADLQLGLRLEDTNADGTELNSQEDFDISYLRLFPTLNFSYRHNDDNSYSVNIGRRVQRPSFWTLNPFRFYRDQFSFIQGNPFLQPAFSYSYDFFYNHKGILSTNIFYSKTAAGFNQFASPESESLLYRVTWDNYFTGNTIGLSQNYTFNKISWWQSQNNILMIKYNYKFNNLIDAGPNNGFRFGIRSNNSFSLKGSTRVQFTAYYNFPYEDNLRDINATYSAGAGISHSFSNNRFQVSLYLNDIFDTIKNREVETAVNNVGVLHTQDYSNRFIRLNISYSFGNNKIDVRNRNFGNNSERRRSGT